VMMTSRRETIVVSTNVGKADGRSGAVGCPRAIAVPNGRLKSVVWKIRWIKCFILSVFLQKSYLAAKSSCAGFYFMASPVVVPYGSFVRVDRHSETPIYLQVAHQLTTAIQRGHLPEGHKLPGTRQL